MLCAFGRAQNLFEFTSFGRELDTATKDAKLSRGIPEVQRTATAGLGRLLRETIFKIISIVDMMVGLISVKDEFSNDFV